MRTARSSALLVGWGDVLAAAAEAERLVWMPWACGTTTTLRSRRSAPVIRSLGRTLSAVGGATRSIGGAGGSHAQPLAGPACHDGRRSCAAAPGCLRSPADPATACRGRCGWVAQGATTGSRIRRRTQRLRHTGPHRGGARPGASLASIVDGVRLRRLVMGQLAPGPASRPGRLVGPRRRALLRERGRPGYDRPDMHVSHVRWGPMSRTLTP